VFTAEPGNRMIGRLIARTPLRHILHFNYARRDAWVAARAAEVKPGSRVLDLGAGSAPYRTLFAHCEYRTQDFTQLTGDQLRDGAYTRVDYVCDAAHVPVNDGSFDLVLSTEMLEHVPDPVAVVREIARILKPEGVLLLTAPLGSGIHQEPYHFYGGYTPYWYRHFLGEAGFDPIEIVPNGGFFRMFGQESVRFLQLSAPWRLGVVAGVLWTPFWCLLFPILGIGLPSVAPWLDGFDRERRFTVGYFVRARKRAQVGLTPVMMASPATSNVAVSATVASRIVGHGRDQT